MSGSRNERLSYEDAKILIKANFPKGCTFDSYIAWTKTEDFPIDLLPVSPYVYYTHREVWKGFADFGSIHNNKLPKLSYDDAKELVRQYFPEGCTLSTYHKWTKTEDFPIDLLPKKPETYYLRKGTWKGSVDFCNSSFKISDHGLHRKLQRLERELNFVGYKEARLIILQKYPNGCRGPEYKKWTKRKDFPKELPINPYKYYKSTGEWISYYDYLSFGKNDDLKTYSLSYDDAKAFIVKEFGYLITSSEYRQWRKTEEFPNDKLPKEPNVYYRRTGDWKGWKDFCSKNTSDLSGYVYMITNPVWTGFVKIGSAVDVQHRLSGYNTGDPNRAYVCQYSKKFSDRIKMERIIHKTLINYRVGINKNEWFEIPIDECISIIDNFEDLS